MNSFLKHATACVMFVLIQCFCFCERSYGDAWDPSDCHSALSGNVTDISVNGTSHALCRTMQPAFQYRLDPHTTTRDYYTGAAAFGIPSALTRFSLYIDNPDPFNASFKVQYQYCWLGLLYFPWFPLFIDQNSCDSSSYWEDTHTTTFSGSDIRGINDTSPDGGYGSKDVNVQRVCVRRVVPGDSFPGDVYAQEDVNNGLVGQKNGQGPMVNLDNKNKICAYYVNSLPEDCNSSAVSTAGSIVGGVMASGLGGAGAVAGAMLGSMAATAICGKIAGSGPCKSPFFSWANSFIGCVDEPLKPGPPIFNVVLPSNLIPVVPGNFAYPNTNSAFFAQNLNSALNNVITIGSTFDQPVIRLTVGDGAANLDLRYKFSGDNTVIDSKPTCSTFPQTSLIPVIGTFCATYDAAAPDRICACLSVNGVCTQQIGCSPRPTPGQTGIKFNLSVTQVTSTDPFDVNPNDVDLTNKLFKPNIYPALNIGFKAYHDLDGDRVELVNNNCVKVRNTTVPANDTSSCTNTAALQNLPLSVTIREYYKNGTNPPSIAGKNNNSSTNYSALSTSLSTDIPITVRDSGQVYGVNFTTIIPSFDNSNRVQFANLITENDIYVPTPSTTGGCFLNCHQTSNFNKCVSFWTTPQNYYNCISQDLSCLLPQNSASCPCSSGAPLVGSIYLGNQYYIPAGQRVYQGICTNDGTATSSNTYQNPSNGNSITFNNYTVTFNTSPTIVNRIIQNKCSSANNTGPSDPNALNVYCPGILYNSPFEDLDNSKMCLQMLQPSSWLLLSNETSQNNSSLCAKLTNKICPAYNTPTTLSSYTSFPRPTSSTQIVNGTCPLTFGLDFWNKYNFVSIFPSAPNNYTQLSQNNFCSGQSGVGLSCTLSATVSNLQFRQGSFPDGSTYTSYLNDTKTLNEPASSLINATQAQLNSMVTTFQNMFANTNGYTITTPATKDNYCSAIASTYNAPGSINLNLALDSSNNVAQTTSSIYTYNVAQINPISKSYTFTTSNILAVTQTTIDNFIANSITDFNNNTSFAFFYGRNCWKSGGTVCSSTGNSSANSTAGVNSFLQSNLAPAPQFTFDQNFFSAAIANFKTAIANAQSTACNAAYSQAQNTTTNNTFTLSSAELTSLLTNQAITSTISNFYNCAAALNNNCNNAYQIYTIAINSIGTQHFCDSVNQLQGTNLSCEVIYNQYKPYITDSSGNSLIGASAVGNSPALPYIDPNYVTQQVNALNNWTANTIRTNVPSDEYAYTWVNNNLRSSNSLDARILLPANYISSLINSYIDPNTTITQDQSTGQFTFVQNGVSKSSSTLILDIITNDFNSHYVDITKLRYFFPNNLEVAAMNFYRPTQSGYTISGTTYRYPLNYFITGITNYINSVYQGNLTFYRFILSSAPQTPTRTCNISTGVENINNGCVFRPGCYNIGYSTTFPVSLLGTDFSAYSAWPTPSTSTVTALGLNSTNTNGQIAVSGFCAVDSTIRPTRACNVVYIGKNPQGVDQYFEYWSPIDTTNSVVQQCIQESQ